MQLSYALVNTDEGVLFWVDLPVNAKDDQH
jgi:hypothetical protein